MKFPLSLGLAAALLNLSAYAGAIPQLVFTEKSDKVLTATVGGNPVGVVQNLGPNEWKWGIPVSGQLTLSWSPAFPFWAEPEGPAEVNFGDVSSFAIANQGYGGLHVRSDEKGSLDPNQVAANGGFGANLTIVSDLGTQVFAVYFNDISDRASAPDGSSTASLLFISAAALFGLSRSRRFTFIAR